MKEKLNELSRYETRTTIVTKPVEVEGKTVNKKFKRETVVRVDADHVAELRSQTAPSIEGKLALQLLDMAVGEAPEPAEDVEVAPETK